MCWLWGVAITVAEVVDAWGTFLWLTMRREDNPNVFIALQTDPTLALRAGSTSMTWNWLKAILCWVTPTKLFPFLLYLSFVRKAFSRSGNAFFILHGLVNLFASCVGWEVCCASYELSTSVTCELTRTLYLTQVDGQFLSHWRCCNPSGRGVSAAALSACVFGPWEPYRNQWSMQRYDIQSKAGHTPFLSATPACTNRCTHLTFYRVQKSFDSKGFCSHSALLGYVWTCSALPVLDF